MSAPTVMQVFGEAGLRPLGPVLWGERIAESAPGIYVVALVSDPNGRCDPVDVAYLSESELARWLHRQPVIYIGRTRRALARRLQEFYRHKHGKPSPHRGGQAVKLLTCQLWVFWSPTNDPVQAERDMIAEFRNQTGRLPFANRRR